MFSYNIENFDIHSYSTLGKAQFGKPQAAQRAALCLGTTVEDLTRLIFTDGGRRSTSSLSTLNQCSNLTYFYCSV